MKKLTSLLALCLTLGALVSPAFAAQGYRNAPDVTRQAIYIPQSTLCPDITDGYINEEDGVFYCKAYCYFDSRTRKCTFNPSPCPDYENSYLGRDNKCHCRAGLSWNDNGTLCIDIKPTCGDNAFLNNSGNCECKSGYKWQTSAYGEMRCVPTSGVQPYQNQNIYQYLSE